MVRVWVLSHRRELKREQEISRRLREADTLKDEFLAERTAQLAERDRQLAERERLIGQLEARNAELARFNYTVAHDLKNPLTTIRNYVGRLSRHVGADAGEVVRGDLRRVDDAASRLHRLLDELQELSRIDRVAMPCEEMAFGELVLATYYDLRYADAFDQIFGGVSASSASSSRASRRWR